MNIRIRKLSRGILAALTLVGSLVLDISSARAQTTYTWANSNVTNTPTTLDWFTGGPNTQAAWTGGTPVSSNLNTIQFFPNTATAVPNTTTVTQGSNLNNGGTAFQLGTLTFSGQAPAPANIDLTMNVTGDALNFSATTGTINLDSLDVGGNGRNVVWNVSNAMQLGTVSSSSQLTLAGNGSSTFNFSGNFTELQVGGASKLIKSGTSTATLSGAVAVSGGLEVNGGLLKLTNANNSITGGITLNGGSLGDNTGTISTATLNNNLITVNGVASLGLTGGTTTDGGIILNSSADLTLATNNAAATVNGAVTGVGSISMNRLGGGSHTQNFNSTNNTFTGTVSFTAASTATLNVNSFVDSASLGAGNIRFVGSAGASAHTFALGSGAIAPVTLDNRRIEIVAGSSAAYTINNNSSQALTINTDLLVGATGARTLTLGGTGTGLSTFGGKIESGNGTVSITKAGSGTWLLSGNNTYTGNTTVSAGTLITTKAAALPGYDAAARVIFSGGTVGVQVGGSGWTTGEVDTLLANATRTSGAIGIDTTNGNLTQWTAFTTTNLGSTLGLTKLGTNTLTLDQANNYAGATIVTAGVINIQNATALGATAAGTTVLSGAALEIQGGITVGAEALTLSGSGISSGGALRNISGTNQYGGLLTLGNATTIISDAGALSLTNTGTITGSGLGLTVGGGGNISISSIIGTGAGTLTKEGTGLLTLNAANTYTGATTVNGGELRWGIANAIAGGPLNINDGGTVNMQTFSDTVGTITIAKGGTITGTTAILTAPASVGGGFISNDGGTMSGFSAGAGLQLANNAGITYNSTGPGSTTLQIDRVTLGTGTSIHVLNIADGDAAVDFEITETVTANGNNVPRTITKTGAGVMQFSGSTANTIGQNQMPLNINQGTVIFNKSAQVNALPTGTITIGDGVGSAGSAVLQFRTSSNQITDNAITINSDGLFDLNGLSETTSGALTSNGGSITTGAGTLSLGAATNTFSSSSTVAGNVAFSGSAASNLTIGGTAGFNGTTSFSGGNGGGITATGTPQIQGTLALGANTRSIVVSGASDQLTISALLTGTNTITKSGNGTLSLSSPASTWSGTLTMQTGTLVAGANAPSGAVGAFGNATSDVNLGVASGNTNASILTGGGFTIGRIIRNATTNTTDPGTRVLTLGGNTAGASEFSGSIFLGTTNQTSKGIQLTAAAGGQVTFSGVIQNPTGQDGTEAAAAAALNAVTKVGAGTVILSNTNTYTGNTVVNEGTLIAASAGSLPGNASAGKISFNGGTLGVRVGGAGWTTGQVDTLLTNATKTSGAVGIDTTNGSVTQWTAFTGTNFGPLGLVKLGSNTLTLDQTNTYSGPTTVASGTLLVNNTIDSGTGSGNVAVSSGGTLGGSGIISGLVSIDAGGFLAPGNSPGQLTVGGLTLNGTSTTTMELGGTTLGTLYDNITITTADSLTYGGNLTVVNFNTYDMDAASFTYDLFSFTGTTSGNFSNVLVNSVSLSRSGDTWTGSSGPVDYSFSQSTGNLVISVVPEPATLALLASGIAIGGYLRSRRRRG